MRAVVERVEKNALSRCVKRRRKEEEKEAQPENQCFCRRAIFHAFVACTGYFPQMIAVSCCFWPSDHTSLELLWSRNGSPHGSAYTPSYSGMPPAYANGTTMLNYNSNPLSAATANVAGPVSGYSGDSTVVNGSKAVTQPTPNVNTCYPPQDMGAGPVPGPFNSAAASVYGPGSTAADFGPPSAAAPPVAAAVDHNQYAAATYQHQSAPQ
ncbi:putative MIZ/SP-RING zinc finger, partial [Trichinella spiralis]